ncbi:hypothetical protein VNI00_005940 [Paramarasmius palmivorus]|uniref:Uncharacterized protein n=1 Tax=Paramarasmius palmivorus TaxID=297713 RepID=A0AAW0DCV6_9AGAR
MVQRSKPGPLDVCWDHMIPRYPAKPRKLSSEVLSLVTEALVAETPRIRALSLNSLSRRRLRIPVDTLVLSLTQPMPLLQYLSICPSDDEANLELPAHILAGGSPLLEKLELHQSKIPWKSSIFAKLTTLDLGGHRLPASDLPNGSEFLQTLGGAPLLEHLSLTDVFPLSIATDVKPAVIALPHLQELYLEVQNPAQTHSCIETFHRLSFPKTINFRLYISYAESAFSSSSPSPLFHTFFKKVSSSGEAKIISLCVGSSHDITLGVKIWYKAIPFDPSDDMFNCMCPTGALASSVEIKWHGTPRRYAPHETIVQEMVKSFDMKHLETIDLREFTEHKGLAKAIFDSLINSTTLGCLLLSEKNIRAFITCITSSAFPALRDLGIFDVNLRHLIREDCFWSLVSALEVRPEKLGRLMIDEGYLFKSEFERLRAVADVMVSTVTYRGISMSDVELDYCGVSEDDED